jgi:hypothetical protein
VKLQHKTMFVSIIGAVIVLTSFVGNEIFKETYKDKASGLANSQSLLATRRDVFNSQGATQRTLNERRLDQNTDLKETEKGVFDQFTESERENNAALDAIKDALKDNEEQKDLLAEHKRIQEQSNRVENDLIVAHNAWVSATNRGEPAFAEQLAFNHAQFAVIGIDGDVSKLMNRTADAIEKQRAETQQKYEHWKRVGYFLFGIGWIMNLTGVIWKREGMKTEGE